MKHTRELAPFDALAFFGQRWPDWSVRFVPLAPGVDEEFYPAAKLVLIDPGDDADWAVAHAAAHLALDHPAMLRGLPFTAQEEADASGLARLWLDG